MKRTPEVISAEMAAITDPAEAEDRVLTDEEVQSYEALEAELKAVNKSGELFARQAAYKTPIVGFPAVIRATPKGDAALDFAFDQYLRTGQANSDLSQRFAQTEGTPSAGGYAVPDGSLAKLTEARTAFGGFANLADSITTAQGNTISWPSAAADLATEADIAAEGAATAAGADFVLGEVSLGAYKYTSAGTSNLPVKVSVELLQDGSFDVQAFVMRKLGERIARKQAYDLVRGSGSGEPLGIMDGTDGDVATASGSVPTYAKLNSLKHALDPAYRLGASFIMNDATLGVVESIVDTQGRPILVPQTQGVEDGPSNGRLLGYPLHIVQECADLSNDVQGIGFGDWRAAYIVRHVKDVQILVNPYAVTGYVVYDAWARMDGDVQDATAYVTMEGTT
jgi:HK97 family phage major capsid protein